MRWSDPIVDLDGDGDLEVLYDTFDGVNDSVHIIEAATGISVASVAGETIEPQSVLAHCRAGLESNFVPSYLQIVDEIPKTASEKPQERFLRERFDDVKAEVHDLEAAAR